MHSHPMPICIEELMRCEKTAQPRPGSARKELRERGEVFGADTLAREGSMAEVVASRGSISIVGSTENRQRSRHEGVRRRGGATGVHSGERGAEQARE
jgi:hypothetical protein